MISKAFPLKIKQFGQPTSQSSIEKFRFYDFVKNLKLI